MAHDISISIAAVVVLGVLAQWAAWRLNIPSIILLLLTGLVAGPMTGWLDPDELLGELLLPVVSLSVAVILFEGGLSLKFRELRNIGGVFLGMTTVGVAVAWVLGAAGAHYFLDFPWPLAALLGAILVVTGPTVIGPLLRHLRLGGQVGSLLKWEGIVVDPVGALLAVLVFTAVRSGEFDLGAATLVLLSDLGLTLLGGSFLGLVGAGVLVLAIRRFWIPDSLQNIVALMLVFAVSTVSNLLQQESGLLAVTVMGIALANQPWVTIRHIVQFKENLTLLLISSLFIILAARLRPDDLTNLGLGSAAFVLALVLVARPASVFAATLGSSLKWPERAFLAWMAPRGIVAAAVASVFALEMAAAGVERAAEMVPVTFLVIICTVALYGFTSGPLARRLKLAHPNPQGVLIVGANGLARALAGALKAEKIDVLMVDSDWAMVASARQSGLPAYYGNVLSEQATSDLDLARIGRVLALTGNDQLNSLACLQFRHVFGSRESYQLAYEQGSSKRDRVSREHRGRTLFARGMTFDTLVERFGAVPKVKTTRLSKEFDQRAFRERYGDTALPLFVLRGEGRLIVLTSDDEPRLEAGDEVVFAVRSAQPAPVSALAEAAAERE